MLEDERETRGKGRCGPGEGKGVPGDDRGVPLIRGLTERRGGEQEERGKIVKNHQYKRPRSEIFAKKKYNRRK
jgi:hypothetical protein